MHENPGGKNGEVGGAQTAQLDATKPMTLLERKPIKQALFERFRHRQKESRTIENAQMLGSGKRSQKKQQQLRVP